MLTFTAVFIPNPVSDFKRIREIIQYFIAGSSYMPYHSLIVMCVKIRTATRQIMCSIIQFRDLLGSQFFQYLNMCNSNDI